MATTAPPAMAPPPEWPPQLCSNYIPIRSLGKGRFGVVVLAQQRVDQKPCAIKMIVHSNPQDAAYAQRERELLSCLTQLRHPNVMQLYDAVATADRTLLVLSYATGRTLQNMLEERGRLSLRCARTVCAQLVDAVEFLHGYAVCHRDIKPDNIIVANEDDDDADGPKDGRVYPADDAEWESSREKWKITLIDFGLARALTPQDMQEQREASTRTDLGASTTGSQRLGVSTSSRVSLSSSSRSKRRSIHKSFSRNLIRYVVHPVKRERTCHSRAVAGSLIPRTMSAVGNRNYAAPEIINHVRESSQHRQYSSQHPVDVMETLADTVAYYGLLVDSYSVGNVIKYCLTGCRPNENVEDAIAFQNNPISLLCRLLCGVQRSVRYRSTYDIPPEVARLIRGLTHPNSAERTTMRAARMYPWIDGALLPFEPPKDIKYLHLPSAAKETTSHETTGRAAVTAVEEGD